jgi:SAM-dependent methyltransferase
MSSGPSGRFLLTHAPEALRRFAWSFGESAQEMVERAERALGTVAWQDEVAVASWLIESPFHAFTAISLLADAPASLVGERIKVVFPELSGLAVPRTATSYEHEESPDSAIRTPLLDRTLRALHVAHTLADPLDTEERALLAAVLLFADVAKGGTAEQREVWRQRLGVDGTVHNEDSAVILDDVMRRILGKVLVSDDGRFSARATTLCAASGLVGMSLRGEVGRDALADLVDLAVAEPDGGERLGRVWSIINRCELTAVRASLWTQPLADAFLTEERAVLYAGATGSPQRASLPERIARMRGGALMERESIHEVEAALAELEAVRPALEARLARSRIWYAEPTLGALSLSSALRLLVNLSGRAASAGIDFSRPWHLDLHGVMGFLRDAAGKPKHYAVRLLETLLEATPTEALFAGELGEALVSFPSNKGGEQAVAVAIRTTPEAEALLVLLGVYEKKSGAAFHQTLKALCDLYGLRKDDFDRVSNEQAYLATMNAARSDKQRLLDFVTPGLIVEVGPGGGVVLALLAERFPGSRIVGLDASQAVVDAHEARTRGRDVGYEMRLGDAFRLPEIFGPGEISTIVFCSVLHEIFSYVEHGDPPRRFQLGAVTDLVAASFRALKRGGRLVIRDGVAPADEPRVLEFLSPTWREGFELFAKTYEARTIPFEAVGPNRVRLSAPDLYEFLTTFTWGPDSFPYEIREQRAVLPRARYVEVLLEACRRADPEHGAVEIPVPGDLASYLQPGYPQHILPHVRVYAGDGVTAVSLPDVNGVWVIEKTAP